MSGRSCRAWRDRVGAVNSLADDAHVRLRVEDGGEPLAHHRLVVSDQASGGGGPVGGSVAGAAGHDAPSPSGSVAQTTKPPSGTGPADIEPPSSATRSRIPVRP
jgi:hypothetical protein